MTYLHREHNIETGEIVETPLTAAEVKQIEAAQKEAAAQTAAMAEAAAKREAVLAALAAAAGLEIDEVKEALR